MFERALIVGKFAPLHAGHQLLIETALRESRQVTVMVYARPDFVAMPQAMRASWIRTLYPAVDVQTPLDPPPDASDDETHRTYVKRFLARAGIAIDAVFTSEAYGDGFAAVLGVPHRKVDLPRAAIPVSGTAIRTDIRSHRQYLHPLVSDALLQAGDLNARA